MRALAITMSAALALAGCAHKLGVNVAVTSSGPGPDQAGGPYRFASQGVGEQPGDFLVRSQIESRLAAKGFKKVEDNPRYVVEVSVTARPLNVGAVEGQATLVKAVGGVGLGNDHVCAVSLRFVDVKTGAEAYKVSAVQHGPVADCNTENFHLVDLALADIPLKGDRAATAVKPVKK